MGSLVVFSDDWGRHPSSCQHLIEKLLDDYEVLWINTIGTRTPKFDRATVSRVISKVSQWSAMPRKGHGPAQPAHLRVLSPLMWPWFGRSHDRWLNQQMLGRAVAKAIETFPRPRCAITTIPLVCDLVGRIDVDAWIYYCVDDLASWPGLDGNTLQQMEGELVRKVDRCVVASEYLQQRLVGMGRDSTLVTHGVDLAFWHGKPGLESPLPPVGALEAPLVVFWGLVDDRLEVEWLLHLAERMKSGTIVLAGPDQSTNQGLRQHSRIHMTGPLDYSELPELARAASVLVMPYRQIPATLAMQPLKLKEYLATGLPCIVSRLPATLPWRDSLDIVDSADDFADAVLLRLSTALPAAQSAARVALQDESWSRKAAQLSTVIASAIECPKPCPTLQS